MITNFNLGKYGALGNQLFQYAALVGVATKNGYTIKIPPRNMKSTGELKLLGHNEKHAPLEEYEYALGCFQLSLAEDLTTKDSVKGFIEERSFCFDKEILSVQDNFSMTGYFQSEKYFLHCKDIVKNEFKFRSDVQEEINKKYYLLNSLGNKLNSIHIRRIGHKEPEQQNIHPLIPLSFYKMAMDDLIKKYPGSKFVIFSDDIEWCKNIFTGSGILFAENNSAVVDLGLMSRCDNHIIANSSFSWWGAWLGHNEAKEIYAPDPWFGPDGPKNTQDLIPSNWLRGQWSK